MQNNITLFNLMKSMLSANILVPTIHFVNAQSKTETINIIGQKLKVIYQETNYRISTFENEAFLDTGFIRQAGQGYGRLTIKN
ncbi:MAG TPA: hypothetical protein PKL96_03110 [Bacteroidales bacterium]|nr:hypothetical protein [Bacteroidales bacterium]